MKWFPPKPSPKKFPSTFPYFGKFGEGPPGPPVYPLWALCGSEGLAILSTYLVEPLLLYWVPIGPYCRPNCIAAKLRDVCSL